MTMSRFAIGLAALALAAGPAFAQTATQPATPAKPATPMTTPAAPAAPAAKPAAPAATQAQAKKININTASASELDTLKAAQATAEQIGRLQGELEALKNTGTTPRKGSGE